jgi:hypothetical protein
MILTKNRILIIAGAIVVSFIVYTLVVLVFLSDRQGVSSDITQQTAPPYDGKPIVAFDDQTNGGLYRSIGAEKYIEIKYFIGEYLSSKGVPKNPVPSVTVTNFKNDLQFLGQSGKYNNIYLFDVSSGSISSNFTVKVVENSDTTQTIATIEPNIFSRDINSYSYENY